MDKNKIEKRDELMPDINKSVSGTFVPVKRTQEFNPAYETPSYTMPMFSTVERNLTTPCGVCFVPVIVDAADRGTFHLCEDCRRAILFLKNRVTEIDELIRKSKE